MLRTAISALFVALSVPGSFAQNVFFEEKFDSGIPSTWTQIHLGSSPDLWTTGVGQVDGTPNVYHEWFCNHGSAFRDNTLVSPPLDLSGLTQATFACEQYQRFANQIFYNKIEVSTNGGQSFVVLQDLAGSPEGYSPVTVSLDAFAGMPSVRVALHYKGTIANDWWVDNVRVLTPQPVHALGTLVAGSTARLRVWGMPAGTLVAIGLSSGPGPTSTPYGSLNLSAPIRRLPPLIADVNGEVVHDLPVPAGSAGIVIHSQALVFFPGGGFDRSNSLTRTVQ